MKSWLPALLFALLLAQSAWTLGQVAARVAPGGDEAVSLAAARGLAEHGVPTLPSGQAYTRDPLFHHIVGWSLHVFGDTPLVGRLPSLLAFLLTAVVMFAALARWHGPWVGLAGSALFLACQFARHLATWARSYALFGLLALLVLVLAIRLLEREEGNATRRIGGLDIGFGLAVLCCGLSHKLGLVYAGGVLAALGLLLRRRVFRHPAAWLGALGLLAAAGVVFGYRPANAHRPVTDWALYGSDFNFLKLARLQLDELTVYYRKIYWHWLPGGLLVVTAGLVLLWRRPEGRRLRVLLLAWLPLMVGLSLLEVKQQRYMYVGLVCYLVLVVSCAAGLSGARPGAAWWRRGLAAGVILGYAAVVGNWNPGTYTVTDAYQRVDPPAALLDELAARVQPGDVVLSQYPHAVHYRLRRLDGLLLQRRDPKGKLGPFDLERESYYGAPIIDTEAELAALLFDHPGAIWIHTDRRFVGRLLSPEFKKLLRKARCVPVLEARNTVIWLRPAPGSSSR